MKKIHIICIAGAGLISFLSVFGGGLWLKKKNAPAPTAASENPAAAVTPEGQTGSGSILAELNSATMTEELGMSETQLKNLIFDIRQKMKEYEIKEKQLEQEKQQVEIARQTLAQDVERLTQLQEKLNFALAAIQDKERALEKSLLEINTLEKTNLQRIAGTYDKMDPAQSGKILSTMAANNQVQDAVKILYYMSERIAGKVLGEIGTSSPEAAAALSLQLKRIKEQ